MSALTVFAPAKLNLFLAVTGRRADGFHDLVSVVAPLAFGDTLQAEPAETYSLTCDDPEVPSDESNLVLKAASVFATTTAERPATLRGTTFRLEKRIPMGAGLGGGSSDGVAALRALNRLSGDALPPEAIATLAAQLGSDCPLFLPGGPVVMRGRGDRVESLPAPAAARLAGRRVLIFKPAFGVATPWAYAQMVRGAPAAYLPPAEAEARLAAWIEDPAAPAENLLFNNMEPAVFAKHLALPTLFDALRSDFGLAPGMSGSGSACFALLPEDLDTAPIVAAIRQAWGESSFVIESRLAPSSRDTLNPH